MQSLIEHGLGQTASLWPDIEQAYKWIHQAAHILNNHEDEDAATVQRRFNGMVGAMARHRDRAGRLSDAIDHFGKVTRSYRPGLFHCYAVPDLPRTNKPELRITLNLLACQRDGWFAGPESIGDEAGEDMDHGVDRRPVA